MLLHIKNIESKVDEYDTILHSQELYNTCETLSTEVDKLEEELAKGRHTVVQAYELRRSITEAKARMEAKADIERVLSLDIEITALHGVISDVKESKNTYRHIKESMVEYEKLVTIKPLLDSINELNIEVEEMDNSIQALTDSAYLYEDVEKKLVEEEKVLEELKKSIEGICPTCGKPYNEGECC